MKLFIVVFSFFVSFTVFSQKSLCHHKDWEKEAFTSVLGNGEHTILSIDKGTTNACLSVEVYCYTNYTMELALNNFRGFEFIQGIKMRHSLSSVEFL